MPSKEKNKIEWENGMDAFKKCLGTFVMVEKSVIERN